ncbi:hypothetical protein OROMI_002244 [Orobanche minor]
MEGLPNANPRFSNQKLELQRKTDKIAAISEMSSSLFVDSYVQVARACHPICKCELRPFLDISYIDNPYRRFLWCPKERGFQCEFFKWVDPWRQPQVEDVNSLDAKEEREKLNMWIEMYSRVNKQNEAYEERMKELETVITEMEVEKKQLKKMVVMMQMVLACVVLFLVSVIKV